MSVAGEEDHGEGDVPKEASPGALVQAKETKLLAHAQSRHFLASKMIDIGTFFNLESIIEVFQKR